MLAIYCSSKNEKDDGLWRFLKSVSFIVNQPKDREMIAKTPYIVTISTDDIQSRASSILLKAERAGINLGQSKLQESGVFGILTYDIDLEGLGTNSHQDEVITYASHTSTKWLIGSFKLVVAILNGYVRFLVQGEHYIAHGCDAEHLYHKKYQPELLDGRHSEE